MFRHDPWQINFFANTQEPKLLFLFLVQSSSLPVKFHQEAFRRCQHLKHASMPRSRSRTWRAKQSLRPIHFRVWCKKLYPSGQARHDGSDAIPSNRRGGKHWSGNSETSQHSLYIPLKKSTKINNILTSPLSSLLQQHNTSIIKYGSLQEFIWSRSADMGFQQPQTPEHIVAASWQMPSSCPQSSQIYPQKEQ